MRLFPAAVFQAADMPEMDAESEREKGLQLNAGRREPPGRLARNIEESGNGL